MAERTTRTDESLNTADHSARSGSVTAQLIRLSLPLILSNILQQFYNTIDTWMVGRYAGSTAFASMGIAGSLMNLFMFIVIGACTGISIMFAQLYGAEDLRHFRQEHYQMLATGTIAALVLSAVGLFSLSSLIRLMQTPGDMVPYVSGYLSLILAGLPLTYLYNYYNGLLRAVGNARVPLFILAGATILNLVMDYLLVGVLSMGTRGAAIATILSQGFSAALCILYLMRCQREFMFRRPDMRISGDLLRKTCALALVTGLHQTGLYIGKMLVQCRSHLGRRGPGLRRRVKRPRPKDLHLQRRDPYSLRHCLLRISVAYCSADFRLYAVRQRRRGFRAGSRIPAYGLLLLYVLFPRKHLRRVLQRDRQAEDHFHGVGVPDHDPCHPVLYVASGRVAPVPRACHRTWMDVVLPVLEPCLPAEGSFGLWGQMTPLPPV